MRTLPLLPMLLIAAIPFLSTASNAQTRPVVRAYMHTGAGWRAVAVDDQERQVFLAGYSEDRLKLIQLLHADDGSITRVNLSLDQSLATVTTDGNVLEIAPARQSELYVIDTESKEIVRTEPLTADTARQLPLADLAVGTYLVIVTDGAATAASYSLVIP